jgi:hypothetical protein
MHHALAACTDHPLQQLPPPDLNDDLARLGARLHWVPVEMRVDGFRILMGMGQGSWLGKVERLLKQQQQQQQRKEHQQEGEQQMQEEEQQQQQQEQEQQALIEVLQQQRPGTLQLLGQFSSAEEWLALEVLPGLERHAWLAGLHVLLSKYCAAAANKREEVRPFCMGFTSAQVMECLQGNLAISCGARLSAC